MKSLGFSVLLCLFFSVIVLAQTPSSIEVINFDKDGLKFDYPSNWTLTDKSSPEIQSLYLSKTNTTLLIIISSPREAIVSADQYINFQSDAHTKYIKAISKSLSGNDQKPQESSLCLDFNGRNVSGTKYSGIYNNEPTVGEIYPFALGNRFLTLVYMRADKENSIGNEVWSKLVKSLRLDNSNKEAFPKFIHTNLFEGGILNGKAIVLVRPKYSKMEYQAGAKGRVDVRIEIDETGKVVFAKAISGNKLLYDSAEYAAKKSKFAPRMLCDKGIRVTGTIIYNFAP